MQITNHPLWWMTLIEVMVAIGVFGIGILGVVSLMTNNISALHRAEVQTTATMLANNWLEMLLHTKHTNRLRQLPWDCLLYQETEKGRWCTTSFGSLAQDDELLILDRGDEWLCRNNFNNEWFLTNREKTQLWQYEGKQEFWDDSIFLARYVHTWSLVMYDDGDAGQKKCSREFLSNDTTKNMTDTSFARYITFTWVQHLPEGVNFSGKIYKANVHGVYKQGALTGKITLETFVADVSE